MPRWKSASDLPSLGITPFDQQGLGGHPNKLGHVADGRLEFWATMIKSRAIMIPEEAAVPSRDLISTDLSALAWRL